jgi:hypothetical protein
VSDEWVDRERDEFERISLTAQVDKDRRMMAQYLENLSFFHARVEEARYRLGRLDERLGS